MIEVKYEEIDKVVNLYNEIKNIILLKKDNPSFKYEKKQYHLYEESKYPGISKKYYNETGYVEYENVDGNNIIIKIDRYHNHQHNGYSGINSAPCLFATIYSKNNEEENILYELEVESRTLFYEAKVTSLELPYDILKQKDKVVNNQEKNISAQEEFDKENQESINQDLTFQETRNLFEELESLYEQYLNALETKKALLLEREEKIKEATKQIMNIYSKKIKRKNKNIKSTKKEFSDLTKLVVKYSTFDIDLIGNSLQQLITIVEGRKFNYKKINYTQKIVEQGVNDSWTNNVKTQGKIIINDTEEEFLYDNTTENKINKLINNGKALLLSKHTINESDNKLVTFYTVKEEQVFCHINFGKFDYIEEFINNIIQYRFQNNMDIFTEKDMQLLMKNFIQNYKEKIIKNYESKIDDFANSLKLNI